MKVIPSEMRDAYSMDGKVEICEYHYYGTGGASRKYYSYSEVLVESWIAKAKARAPLHYPPSDRWLYQALDKYNISSQHVLIVGSEEPCYEAVCIARDATVTMVEYQKVESSHPSLSTMTYEEFCRSDILFDACVSVSSVEHSGLGRYGDELDPDGDIKSMKEIYNSLKPGGLCFLGVPIGKDQVLWNAHRVYGHERLPLLIQGFEIVESFGLIYTDFEQDENVRRLGGKHPFRDGVDGGAHQPILVLKRIETNGRI